MANTAWSNSTGAAEPGTVWGDLDFDSAQHGFDYAHVIEIPLRRCIAYS